MSVLSAAILTAALLGADPRTAASAPAVTTVVSDSPVVHANCEHALAVTCGDSDRCSEGCCLLRWCKCCCKYRNGGHGWCPWGDDDDCDDCDLCCWDHHLINYCIGPGDFHPHYPYPPVCHGYYYFRPYNHEHVFRDAELAAGMGGDARAPYSVEFLKTRFPPAPIEYTPRPPARDSLPNLEDLLSPSPILD